MSDTDMQACLRLAEAMVFASATPVLARSLPALTKMVQAHPDGMIAVVSHTATIRLLLCSILGIDPPLYRARIAQDTACLNRIEFSGISNAKVTLLNDTSHYAKTEN